MKGRQIFEPRRVSAWQGWGVYADYDANAPDTKDLILVATKELAEQVCSKLNENPRACQLAFVDGYEWSKSFQIRKAFSTRKADFATSFEAAMTDVEFIADEEEGE